MAASIILRPGIALGPYPQREDIRDSWLDQAAANFIGFVRQRAVGRNPRYGDFLQRVEQAARGLDDLQDAEIRASLPALRRQLHSEGLQEALVARAFAIVRILGRYAERLVGHEATLRFVASLRPWLFERLERGTPAASDALRQGDALNWLERAWRGHRLAPWQREAADALWQAAQLAVRPSQTQEVVVTRSLA